MSTLLDTLMWQIVREVEPTPAQKDGAQRSHEYLRSLLATGQIASRWTSSYLSGSYARDTAIRPIDDVDIVFELAPAVWGGGLTLFDPHPAPVKVLEAFANAIRYRYPVSSVYGQRRSVRLELYHLDIDVVPAFPDPSNPLFVRIPDRESGDWIRSSPKKHSENATRVNQRQGGRFKPLVKLLKFWNSNLPETTRAKSFMIETMAVRLFDALALNSLEDGAITFWDFLASRYSEPTLYHWSESYDMSFSWLSISVPDTAGTGSNTAARLDDARARALAAKARMSRDRLIAAQKARSPASQQSHVYDAFHA